MNDKKLEQLLKESRSEFDNLPRGRTGRRTPAPSSLWKKTHILSSHFSRNSLAKKLGINLSVLQRGLLKFESNKTSVSISASREKTKLSRKIKKNTFVKVIPIATEKNTQPLDKYEISTLIPASGKKIVLELSTKSGTTITIYE